MNEYQSIINLFERLKERYGSDLGLQNFVLRITDNSDFKSPRANSFCIEIPLQYIQMIEMNCNLILCNRNLFKYIGDYQSECLNRENFKISGDVLTGFGFKTYNTSYKGFFEMIPNDNTRKIVAGYLSQIIISFIAYHELGHVRQLNYTSKENGLNDFIFQQQVKEIDADVFGVHFLCYHLFDIMDNNWENNSMNLIFKTKKELFRASIYSILLFFYLTNKDDQIYNDKKEHPHPIVRLDYCMFFIQKLCILNDKLDNEKEFTKLMHLVIVDFDETLSYHLGLDNTHLYYKKFKDPNIRKIKLLFNKYIRQDQSLNFNRYNSSNSLMK